MIKLIFYTSPTNVLGTSFKRQVVEVGIPNSVVYFISNDNTYFVLNKENRDEIQEDAKYQGTSIFIVPGDKKSEFIDFLGKGGVYFIADKKDNDLFEDIKTGLLAILNETESKEIELQEIYTEISLKNSEKFFNSALKAFLKNELEREELIKQLKLLLEKVPDCSSQFLSILTNLHQTQSLSLNDYSVIKQKVFHYTSGGEPVWINLLTKRLLSPCGDEKVLESGIIIQDDYRLEEKIDEDSMGITWKATHLIQEATGSRDKFVAIKFLRQSFFKQRPNTLKRLVREFDQLRKLNHANLLNPEEISCIGSQIILVMKFLHGIPLNAFIENHHHGVSLKEAESIIRDMGYVFAHAHQKGVARLDLKPVNIDYEPIKKITKIIDFGIARSIKPSEFEDSITEPYLSFEALSDLEPEQSDDIYALACVVYELLSGKHPYDRKTAIEAEKKSLFPPKAINGLKPQQNEALLRGLALRSTDRTPSIDEFLAGLFPPSSKKTTKSSTWVNLFTKHLLSPDREDRFFKPGMIFDNYRLERIVDEDGMGVVWEASIIQKTNQVSDNYVAIKFVNQNVFKPHPETLKALAQEYNDYRGSRYEELHHHHIVRADDLDRTGSKVYLVRKFLEGIPLKTFIKEHPNGISFKEAKPIIKSLGEILTYAHNKRISSLNFDPTSIFYDPEIRVTKLILLDITHPFKSSDTEPYKSLETLSSLDYQADDDVYALACVTYELLSGKHPFGKKTALEAKRENLFPEAIKGLNYLQNRTLLRGLSVQRENRIPTVKTFLANFFSAKSQFLLALSGGIILLTIVGTVGWVKGWWTSLQLPFVTTYQVEPQKEDENIAVRPSDESSKKEEPQPVLPTLSEKVSAVAVPVVKPTTIDPNTLTIHIKKTMWVQITDNKNEILQVGPTEAILSVKGTPPFLINVGIPQKVDIEYLGKTTKITDYPNIEGQKHTFIVGNES